MNAERFNTFSNAYRRNLREAVNRYPEEYALGRLGFETDPDKYAEVTANKMLETISIKGVGAVNKDSRGFKMTCKELGIKHTYTAIKAYLHGE